MDIAMLEVARDNLNARVEEASKAVNAFPRDGIMGLPTDEVRLSPEYRTAKAKYAAAFEMLRSFNRKYAILLSRKRKA